MNHKKTIQTLIFTFLLLGFFVATSAQASEVTGNLSSTGISSVPTTSQGSSGTIAGTVTGGGSTVTGTFGGGSSSGNSSTLSGTVTGGSGGGGGGGSLVASAPTAGSGVYTQQTNSPSTFENNVTKDGALLAANSPTGASNYSPAETESSEIAIGTTTENNETITATTEEAPENIGTNQLAAVSSFGSILGSWYSWLFLLLLLILGYYIYKYNQRDSDGRYRK